jgi:hypothetical protein
VGTPPAAPAGTRPAATAAATRGGGTRGGAGGKQRPARPAPGPAAAGGAAGGAGTSGGAGTTGTARNRRTHRADLVHVRAETPYWTTGQVTKVTSGTADVTVDKEHHLPALGRVRRNLQRDGLGRPLRGPTRRSPTPSSTSSTRRTAPSSSMDGSRSAPATTP